MTERYRNTITVKYDPTTPGFGSGGGKSTEARCEPRPEWRERDGWHWVEYPSGHREIWHWWKARQRWEWARRSSDLIAMCRYLAPVTPPATVAALVEALEWEHWLLHAQCNATAPIIAITRNNERRTADQIKAAAKAALALYRGETT